jgi:hypothetical protein
MGLDGRIYIDGGGISRVLEVEVTPGSRDRFTSHDPTAHEKLDAIVAALAPVNYLESAATETVGTTLTTLAIFDCRNWKKLGLVVLNTGTANLGEFKVAVKYKGTESFRVRLETAADYTTNTATQSGNSEAMAIAASGDLTTLAGGSEGWLELNVERVGFVVIQVQSTGSTDLEISAILK